MNSPLRTFRRFAGLLALVALALGVCAAPAFAESRLEVKLASQASEIQSVFVQATGGTFRLGFEGEFTPDIAFNPTAPAMEAALNGLAKIKTASGDGSVQVETTSPGLYLVTFSGGSLANADVPQLTTTDGTTPLSGPGSRVVVRPAYEAGVSRSDKVLAYTARVSNEGSNPTTGTVTLEVELPSGPATSVRAADGSGWTCSEEAAVGAMPAKAICTRSDALPPGGAYALVTVVAGLGPELPDTVVARATASGGLSATASSVDEFAFAPSRPFRFTDIDTEVIGVDGSDYTQAGGHPFSAAVGFSLSTYNWLSVGTAVETTTTEDPRKVVIDLPRGFVANARAVGTQCPSIGDVISGTCPAGSAVGVVSLDLALGGVFGRLDEPIFSIRPEFGTPAQFAFYIPDASTPVTLTPRLRPDDGYAISLDTTPAPFSPALRRVNEGAFCDFGAEVSGNTFLGCKEAGDPTASPVPLVTNPTRCTGAAPVTTVSIDTWQHPGSFIRGDALNPVPTGCDQVDFHPEASIAPTNRQADTPTGLDVSITMPTEGLESKTGISQSNLDTATVKFPAGMSINPASAGGLGACTEAEVKLGSNAEAECPESSKVGTVEIETPLIEDTLTGNVYVAKQNHNPFNATVGLYMVFSSKKNGFVIKVAGKLVTDPITGQVTSVFTENPEDPFSRLALKFNSGPRAPLINPPSCGTYAITSEFSPWSAADPAHPTPQETVTDQSQFRVTEGPNGSPCPPGNLEANLKAGLQSNRAGAKTPFNLTLTREDGSKRFTGIAVKAPTGLTAYLKGIPYCSDATLAGISEAEETGRSELQNPACPATSQVGTVLASAGSGPFPFQAPGRVYLAGPYKGAPISLAVVTPAVAGPFDLGNVVIRNAVYVNPETAQVTTVSDPIPTILHGIPLDIRQIRLSLDRPGFTAAPTDCEPMSVIATVKGEGGASASPSSGFQVAGCKNLPFKPNLKLQVLGKTHRNAKPRLKAVLTANPGEANIARAQVNLPHSEFVEQNHIRTVCTRVQFAEGNGNGSACPTGSIYGRAKAWTPLLDEPLEGYVYLRSNGGERKLPDLVAALDGQVSIALWGKIDSGKNHGIRNTFEVVPDAPVSRFVLEMNGGKKGLLVNSENLCSKKAQHRANVRFTGQNGKVRQFKPLVQNQCGRYGKKHKTKKNTKHGRSAAR